MISYLPNPLKIRRFIRFALPKCICFPMYRLQLNINTSRYIDIRLIYRVYLLQAQPKVYAYLIFLSYSTTFINQCLILRKYLNFLRPSYGFYIVRPRRNTITSSSLPIYACGAGVAQRKYNGPSRDGPGFDSR